MKTALAILFLIAAQLTSAQPKSYSFEKALALQATDPRPMVVFIKTDWCKYCKILENTTLKNPETVWLLDEFFYFIPFDAESRDLVSINGGDFRFRPKAIGSGTHELADELADGIYPTIIVLNPDLTVISKWQSYIDSNRLNSTLELIKNK